MINKKKKLIVVLFLLSPFAALCQLSSRQERNLTAFTKLYGYVRFFHPSDEAPKIDWGRFAIYGNQAVLNARNDEELISRLNSIFKPIAPSVKILPKSPGQDFSLSEITPPDPEKYKVVFWQHIGLSLPGGNPDYKAVRINRLSETNNVKPKPFVFYPLMPLLDVGKYAGKEITIRMSLKGAANSTLVNSVMTSSSTDTVLKPAGYLNTLLTGNRIDSAKRFYTYKATINAGTKKMLVGVLIQEDTRVSVDDLSISVLTGNRQTELSVGKYQGEPIARTDSLITYAVKLADSTSASNKYDPPLFDSQLKIGSAIEKEIVSGVSCVIPLALYGNNSGTFPVADTAELHLLQKHIYADIPAKLIPEEPSVRFGAITIAWNAFKHFFPYWDGTSKSAETILHEALNNAYADKDRYQFLKTLKLMTAPMNDGHIFTELVGDTTILATAPLNLAFADNKVVIKDVIDPKLNSFVHPGDIINLIDGKPALASLHAQEELVSGSPQFKQFKALLELLTGAKGKNVKLVLSRNGQLLKRTIPRDEKTELYRRGSFSNTAPASGWIRPSIYYSNLTTDSLKTLGKAMPDLLKAKAIIFDLRGYPVDNINELIAHLLNKAENTNWIFTPQILYPDYQSVSYSGSGWYLSPEEPLLHAKIYFLSDASTMSYAESLLGYIKDFKLATIIGGPSAGANGEINYVYLPGVYRVSFSGLRVTNHDGSSSYHGQGIKPDISVYRSLKGLRNGKDEILEKAIAISLNAVGPERK